VVRARRTCVAIDPLFDGYYLIAYYPDTRLRTHHAQVFVQIYRYALKVACVYALCRRVVPETRAVRQRQ